MGGAVRRTGGPSGGLEGASRGPRRGRVRRPVEAALGSGRAAGTGRGLVGGEGNFPPPRCVYFFGGVGGVVLVLRCVGGCVRGGRCWGG